jgi:hypothetical protein
MTFHLTQAEVQSGFDAIEHHGYGALLPDPPEWTIVKQQWLVIKDAIVAIDLDEYRPNAPLRVYAPKSSATVRVLSLLHPIDLIIYTALTLIAKDDLEAERVPTRKKVVFAYRADSRRDRLYGTKGGFQAFLDRARTKARHANTKLVAVADIADFYPRIYQHRLENVIKASARSARVEEVARVLVAKLIPNLLGKNSYGIPIGPFASRILGEAVLIDVDASLLSDGVEFVRWVDDYSIFCKSESQAQKVLFRLAEYLFENQGEPLRVCRRLQLLRRWSHEQADEQQVLA